MAFTKWQSFHWDWIHQLQGHHSSHAVQHTAYTGSHYSQIHFIFITFNYSRKINTFLGYLLRSDRWELSSNHTECDMCIDQIIPSSLGGSLSPPQHLWPSSSNTSSQQQNYQAFVEFSMNKSMPRSCTIGNFFLDTFIISE